MSCFKSLLLVVGGVIGYTRLCSCVKQVDVIRRFEELEGGWKRVYFDWDAVRTGCSWFGVGYGW